MENIMISLIQIANMFGSLTNNKRNLHNYWKYHMGNIGGMRWWRWYIGILAIFQIIAIYGQSKAAIGNISLLLDPTAVRRGQHATLRCIYDLDGAPLYSVKFYRGLREFYRYSPSEIPASKIFPFPGFHVDLGLSNASQVVLKNVGFGLSGNFSCEVTADAPSFSTKTAWIQMQVVELPATGPILITERDRYESGDVLRGNCTSPPSKPQAELTLTINSIVIYSVDPLYIKVGDGLMKSQINIRLQLQSSHFGGQFERSNGLILRCIAQIGQLYQQVADLELGVPALPKDPIPARVTSSSSTDTRNQLIMQILTFPLIYLSVYYRYS